MLDILAPWRESDAAGFGRRPLPLRHNLIDSPLFCDSALARLIEATPGQRLHVHTLPRDAGNPRAWREGDISGLTGAEVLKAVAKGNILVYLQRVQEAYGAYSDILDDIYREIEARLPGFRSYKRSMSVLISSPCTNAACHSGAPGQSLWQVRGKRRVWISPAHPPFLPQKAIENIVLERTAGAGPPYDPAFDEAAETFELGPGDWATWPRHAPHRSVNGDRVNVSFTTEHWTDELRAGDAVDYANGLLRPLLGGRDPSREVKGPAFLAKFALTGAHKTLRSLIRKASPLTIDFRVDPKSAEGFIDIAPYRIMK